MIMAPQSSTQACTFLATSSGTAHVDGEIADPRIAALNFMIAAQPSSMLSADLLENYESYKSGITSTFETSLVGTHQSTVEVLNGVPGAMSPVKAKLAYVQTPHPEQAGTTVLNLVWRLEVEMADNYYETTVDARRPTRILSSVDWVSDSPIPNPPPSSNNGTYNVWSWGINDPTCGKRSTEEAPFDSFASPAGWHSIPANKDPNSNAKGKEYVTSDTTWGNNVSLNPHTPPLLRPHASLSFRSLLKRTGKVKTTGRTTIALLLKISCSTTSTAPIAERKANTLPRIMRTSRLPSSSIPPTWSMTCTIGTGSFWRGLDV